MSLAPHAKSTLARVLARSGIIGAASAVQRRIDAPFVRVVNYHSVARRDTAQFEQQLRFFAREYVSIDETALLRFLAGGWRPPRPGLILSFDDGLRTDFDVAAPLIEKHGFTGWFFVPVGLVTLPPHNQRTAARERLVDLADDYEDGRVFLSTGEIRQLAQRHVVGCHTESHVRLREDLSAARLRAEITESKQRLERIVGKEVSTFCWVGGEEESYSRAAAAMIASAGYRLSFMTNSRPVRSDTHPLQLQRTNIDAHDSIELVALKLSGLLDLYYLPKRRRVNRLTQATA